MCAGRDEASWLRAKIPRGTRTSWGSFRPRSALGTRSVFMRAPPTRLVPPGPHRRTGRGRTGIGLLRFARYTRWHLLRVTLLAGCRPCCLRCARSARALGARDGNSGGGREGVRREPASRAGGARIKTERVPSASRGRTDPHDAPRPPRDLRAEPARLAGSLRTPSRRQRPPRSRLPTGPAASLA